MSLESSDILEVYSESSSHPKQVNAVSRQGRVTFEVKSGKVFGFSVIFESKAIGSLTVLKMVSPRSSLDIGDGNRYFQAKWRVCSL
jgi:hypothetical protein